MSKKNVEWEWKIFEECLDKINVPIKIPKNKYLEKGCYPIVSQEEELISGFCDNKEDLIIVNKPVVIFGDHTRNIKYIDFDFAVGADGVKILVPTENINSKFFYFFLKSVDIKNLGYARHYRLLKELMLPIPPLDEQERIVKVLDDAFEKIDDIKTTAETNLQNAKEVFNAALSHEFDKTRFRTEKLSVCTYIRPPKNETIKGLKQTSTVSFLPMEDLGIHTRSISAIKSKLLSEVEGSYTCFANNDVLLAKVTPCFENGKMGIAENLVNGVGFGSSEYIVFRPSQNVDNVYLFYFLMTKDFVNEGKKQMLGACGLKRLSKDYVANTQIPLPPLSIQKQIVAKLDSLSEKVKQLESNYKQVLADCDELKKALLKQAFEGML